jgi:hypothetical protein
VDAEKTTQAHALKIPSFTSFATILDQELSENGKVLQKRSSYLLDLARPPSEANGTLTILP